MKLILSIFLFLVVLLSCYAGDIYLSFWPPQPGKTVYLTIRSQQPFNFDQEKAFGGKRDLAVSQYTPLYSYAPEGTESCKKKMQDLISKATALQSKGQRESVEFEKYLRKEFGVDIGAESASTLLHYSNFKNLVEAIVALQESILQGRIVEDPKPLKGKKTVEVRFSKTLGTMAFPVTEVITLEQARESLRSKISQVFWQVDKGILDPIVRLAVASMAPNLKYDQVENDRRIEEIIRRYPSKTVLYKPGDILVPFRKVLNEEDVLLLSAHQDIGKKTGRGSAPWVVFAIFFSVGAYALLPTRVFSSWSRGKAPFLLHLSVLLGAVFILDLVLLLTSFPIYALPTAFIPLLLIMLYPEKVSVILSTVLGVLLVSFFVGRSLQTVLFFGFGAIMAVLATPVVKKRSHIMLPSLIVGCTNAAAVLFLFLDGNDLAGWAGAMNKAGLQAGLGDENFFLQMGWAFAGGFLSGPLALLLLPFFEHLWNTASTFELFKYTDLDHPLMKDLLIKAPGTYQHTMTVAHLAQGASERIGADTLLVRIGAYYHDIGKTVNPRHFVENQFGCPNLHQDLPPEESVKIITRHVEDGLRLGREAGLPEVVLEFIPEHHGTQLLEFFYDKAAGSCSDGRIREGEFRYSGPKPQRVETAVLMIADAVEAASRTLHEPTRETIDAMVRHIIEVRIADGQFDECDLSTRDIAAIRETLAESLAASFHSRVEYPWQKETQGSKEEKSPHPDNIEVSTG